MAEFEIVGGAAIQPPNDTPQDGGPSRRLAWVLAPALLAVAVAIALGRGRSSEAAPPVELPVTTTSIALTETTEATPETTRPPADPYRLSQDEADELLATFGDQVVFIGTGVDDSDQVPRAFVQLISTGERFPLPVAGQPMTVVDDWLLVRSPTGVDVVDLTAETWEQIAVLDDARISRQVELLPDSVRIWSWGRVDEPVESVILAIGSWETVPTPPDPPDWAQGHQVFFVPGTGTFRANGDQFEKISDGRLVGHNRDYLVIADCPELADSCDPGWLDRRTLEPVEIGISGLGGIEYLNLAPTGGTVFFGLKVVDFVNDDSFLVRPIGDWNQIVAQNNEAALVSNGNRFMVVDKETGNGLTISGFAIGADSTPSSVSASDYPLIEAAIDG